MPTYLCHGFRWHRKSIVYYVVIRDLDDVAPFWIMAPASSIAMLRSLYEMFDFIPPSAPPHSSTHHHHSQSFSSAEGSPYDHLLRRARRRSNSLSQLLPRRPASSEDEDGNDVSPTEAEVADEDVASFNTWSRVKFLEEYSPEDEKAASGPWAYVADYMVRVDSSVSVLQEMQHYEEHMRLDEYRAMSGSSSDETGREHHTRENKRAGWLEKLRDRLQRGEDIRWYIVVCGDEKRSTDLDLDGDTVEEEDEEDEEATVSSGKGREYVEDTEDESEFRLPEFLDVKPRHASTTQLQRHQQTLATLKKVLPSRSALLQKPGVSESGLRSLKAPRQEGELRMFVSTTNLANAI